jgi:hypothetical protein
MAPWMTIHVVVDLLCLMDSNDDNDEMSDGVEILLL